MDLIVGFTPDLEADFYQQALFAQDFVCLAASDHPRIGAKKLTRKTFSAEGCILVTASGTGHSIVDKVLARNKVERRVVLRVESYLGVARILAQTEFLVSLSRCCICFCVWLDAGRGARSLRIHGCDVVVSAAVARWQPALNHVAHKCYKGDI